jgi:hypothetical protein
LSFFLVFHSTGLDMEVRDMEMVAGVMDTEVREKVTEAGEKVTEAGEKGITDIIMMTGIKENGVTIHLTNRRDKINCKLFEVKKVNHLAGIFVPGRQRKVVFVFS